MYQGRSMVSVTVDGQETLYRIPDWYTFVEDIRRQCFDPAEWNEAVSAIRVREGEEDAAAKFNTLWCESMKNLSPGSSCQTVHRVHSVIDPHSFPRYAAQILRIIKYRN